MNKNIIIDKNDTVGMLQCKASWYVRGFLLVSLILLLVPFVSAAEFSNIVSPADDVYYNVSRVANPVSAVPLEDVIWLASLGIILLVLSFFARPDQCNDIIAVMAIFPLGVASWRFLTIDFMSYGVAGVADAKIQNRVFMLMEQHSSTALYHEAMICGIFFVIAIINAFRIILLNRQIVSGGSGGDDDE